MQKTYTVEEVAAMSGLSVRTVRNYLSMGVLEGEKTEGAWRFTAEQFGRFLDQDMVRQSVKAKANAVIYDFLLQEKKTAPAACAVLDLPVPEPEAEASLRDTLLEQVNELGLACAYRWEGLPTARLIVRGAPPAVAALLAKLNS